MVALFLTIVSLAVVATTAVPIEERECYHCASPVVHEHQQQWNQMGLKEMPPTNDNCDVIAHNKAYLVNTTKCNSPCVDFYVSISTAHRYYTATVRGCQDQITGAKTETSFLCENGNTHGVAGAANTTYGAFTQMILCTEPLCNKNGATPYPNCNKQSKQVKCHKYTTIGNEHAAHENDTCTGNYCAKFETEVTVADGKKMKSTIRDCTGVNVFMHDKCTSNLEMTIDTYKYTQTECFCGENDCNGASIATPTLLLFTILSAVVAIVRV